MSLSAQAAVQACSRISGNTGNMDFSYFLDSRLRGSDTPPGFASAGLSTARGEASCFIRLKCYESISSAIYFNRYNILWLGRRCLSIKPPTPQAEVAPHPGRDHNLLRRRGLSYNTSILELARTPRRYKEFPKKRTSQGSPMAFPCPRHFQSGKISSPRWPWKAEDGVEAYSCGTRNAGPPDVSLRGPSRGRPPGDL